jgi:hypothetical protein
MNNLDKFLGRKGLRSFTPHTRIEHVFSNVIFDDLGDESVQGSPAGSGLLKNSCTLIISLDRAFDRLDLTAQAFEAIE